MKPTLVIVLIVIIFLGIQIVGNEDGHQPSQKIENLNVKITKVNIDRGCKKQGYVEVVYSIGQLYIPCKYYKTGSVSPSHASIDIVFLWPSLKGVRETEGARWYGKDSVRLFVTFEGSSETMRTGGDGYERAMAVFKSRDDIIKRQSSVHEGLTEYWYRMGDGFWQMGYLVNDISLLTPGGNPLVFGCGPKFGDSIQEIDKKRDVDGEDCGANWKLDESMWMHIQFKGHMLRNWPSLYEGILKVHNEMLAAPEDA